MRKGVLCILLLFLLTACDSTKTPAETQQEAEAQFFAMNTRLSFTAYGEGAETAVSDAEEHIMHLETLWSVTDEESEIYALNHSHGEPVTVSPETAELISYAVKMAEQTNAALDPTIYPVLYEWGFTTGAHRVPSDEELSDKLVYVGYGQIELNERTARLPEGVQIDLGAVAKGYAGDLITAQMKEQGIRSALLNLGGNIQVIGAKPDGSLWRVGLRDPFTQGSFGVLEVSDCAVVTSGGYQKNFSDEAGIVYHHILDPATGKPANHGLASVTVISKEGRMCDALSTALFVMGTERAVTYWQENGGFEMVLVDENGLIYVTEGIEQHFSLTTEYTSFEVTIIKQT